MKVQNNFFFFYNLKTLKSINNKNNNITEKIKVFDKFLLKKKINGTLPKTLKENNKEALLYYEL